VIWSGGVICPADPAKMYVPGTTKELIDANARIWAQLMPELTQQEAWRTDNLDLFVPTQVATWILRNLSKTTGFPLERIVEVIGKWGNCGAANVPLAAYDARQRGLLKEGIKVLFFSGGVGYNFGMVSIIW
jgi:3-oxoacyl-[acyl-carrier-protein] synthase III